MNHKLLAFAHLGAAVLMFVAVAVGDPDLAAAADNNPPTISLVVKGGQVVAGPQVYRLKRDDDVTLDVVSDQADELHVHGYDLQIKLEANQRRTVKFVAKRTGRFNIELHKSGAELGVLEIYPK
jgi:hypothetical protein